MSGPGNPPLAALRHHVSGAVERGEAEPIIEQPVPLTAPAARVELDRRIAEASDDKLLEVATLVGVAQSVRFDKARQVVERACEQEIARRPHLAERYDALQRELDALAADEIDAG